jgi:very-short-patch-repair endonuclease
MKKCKYCEKEFEDGRQMGGHQIWCKNNPNHELMVKKNKDIINLGFKGKKLSDEQKEKISKSRKKYLMENPDKVPYKLNHSSKTRYPERYFKRILKGFISQYRIPETLYEIDFANPDKKIAIEIDGEQHYSDKKMIDHDLKRDLVLKSLGWRTIRIRWSHYKVLSKKQREEIIENLMSHSYNIEEKITLYKDHKIRIENESKNKRLKKKEDLLNDKIKMILESEIDFSKFGWVKEVSILLNVSENSGGRFIRKHMKDFYEESCFKRRIKALI